MALLLARAMRGNKAFRLALVDAQQAEAPAGKQRDGQDSAQLAGLSDVEKINQYDLRVSALTAKSQALFESLGLWQSHIAPQACPYQNMYVWDAEGTGSIRFSALDIHEAALGYIVENSVITEALNEALREQDNITQFRGERVSSLLSEPDREQQPDNRLILADGTQLQGKLLIAADGANSFIRQQAGFKVREWSYEQQAIVATVQTEKSHDFTASQCFIGGGPLAFLPLLDTESGHASQCYSSIVWSCAVEKAQELMSVDDVTFQKSLQEAFENRLGAVQALGKRMSFPLWQRHATAYVQGGLALIGDAAHSIHPLAGQGVNMGLLDVESLGQVVLTALNKGEDFSSEQVLSRYQRQRKAHNLSMMSLMEVFKRGFAANDLSLRWLRNIGLNAVDSSLPLKRQLMKKAMGI